MADFNIESVDQNFAVAKAVNAPDLELHDVRKPPFRLYGLYNPTTEPIFKRMPTEIAEQVSEGVVHLHKQTAGGRVRFSTDSPYIVIKAVMKSISRMRHMPMSGSTGFDLYLDTPDGESIHYRSFIPAQDVEGGYESKVEVKLGGLRYFTINFPLYSGVSELYIGLEDGAALEKAPAYKHSKPIVFYGSSITQGGCASRPGNAYENIVSRALQTDYLNLGFSGSAKGEPEIAQYIAGLDMSVFVYDYDHNAPTPEHLEATHQRMFSMIREQNPNLPILILSRPKARLTETEQKRLSIIRRTYDEAIAAGDKHTYMIDGPTLMRYAKNDGTVDIHHPNDLGFHSMAKVLIPQLRGLL